MNLLRVSLRNFLSHRDTDIAFPDGLTAVTGLNGSGKSSLIKDAVTWALWGKSRVTGAGDDLIFYGEDNCTVVVEFKVNNTDYIVTRTRMRDKKTILKLEIVYESGMTSNESSAVIKDTQERINAILGMTYDIFKNSSCIEQGEADSFSNLTPQDAGKVIMSILQLNRYAAYRDHANQYLTEAKTEIGKLNAAIGYLQEQILLDDNTYELKQQKETELIEKGSKLNELNQEYVKVELLYNNLSAQRQSVNNAMVALIAELNGHTTTSNRLAKQGEILEKINGKCPVCETKLDEAHKMVVKQKVAEEVAILHNKRQELERQIALRKTTLDDLDVKLNSVDLKSYRGAINILSVEVSTLEVELKNLTTIETKVSDLKLKLDENGVKLAQWQTQESLYTELVNAFGSRGIPLLIVDNTLRELDILINDHLKLLSDLPITIELCTQRESSTGDLIDTFQILITNGIESRPYFNYSGGERLLIDLAIRLGLSELLARRNNFKVESLIIDEGLGSLDEINQLNFVNTLKRLSTKFSKILVITHTQAKDYFDNYISVRKGMQGSEVVSKFKDSVINHVVEGD